MTWELLSVIGTIAFAVSGAIVAMEEEYDILGVFVLALTTAFGGGMIRNVLIGLPVEEIWHQGFLFKLAILAIIIIFILPKHWLFYWNKPGLFFDAIGLSAFAVQGALAAVNAGYSLTAVVVAATLTGCGGGIVRDILAGRKPLVFRTDIYAAWAILGGTVVALDWINLEWEKYVLTALLVILRLLSVHYKWHLPRRSVMQDRERTLKS